MYARFSDIDRALPGLQSDAFQKQLKEIARVARILRNMTCVGDLDNEYYPQIDSCLRENPSSDAASGIQDTKRNDCQTLSHLIEIMVSKLLFVAVFAFSAYAFPDVFSAHTIGESGPCGNLAGLTNSEDKDVARVAGILVKMACDGNFQLQHYAEIDKCLAEEGNDQMKGCSAMANMTICDEGIERFSCAITNSAKTCGAAEEDVGYMARTMQLGLLLLGKDELPTELKDCFGALMKMFEAKGAQ